MIAEHLKETWKRDKPLRPPPPKRLKLLWISCDSLAILDHMLAKGTSRCLKEQ